MSPDPAIVPYIKPPYYVVIFTSRRTPGDDGYGAMAERMGRLQRRSRVTWVLKAFGTQRALG
jgi:hypothetical protein